MLNITKAKSYNISCKSVSDNEIIFSSEQMLLRIQTIENNIFRISFTAKKVFEEKNFLGILPLQRKEKLSDVNESQSQFTISTNTVKLSISKLTGQVCAFANNSDSNSDEPFYAENEELPHELEAFDYFTTLQASEKDIEYFDTPDGKKQLVKNPKKVFDKVLYRARHSFCPKKGEHLYGLGQHTEGFFNLRNTTRYLHQANMKIAFPFLMSSNGYGILYNIYSPSIFEDNKNKTSFFAQAVETFDYFLISGTPKEVIAGYRKITGKANLLPSWSYGYIQSQERYDSQTEILETVQEYRKRKLGLDCIVLDWMYWENGKWGQKSFDPSRFPSPDKMVKQLKESNTSFMMSVWPSMNESSEDYKELLEAGYILPNSTTYNAFDEKAGTMFAKQLVEGLYSKGVDAFWNDSTEPFLYEWGMTFEPEPALLYSKYVEQISSHMPLALSNAFALYHSKTIYDTLRKESPNKRVINLTRSGYIGQQRFSTVLWSGDISANWKTLKRQITEMLSLVSSGYPWWTIDIGAFFTKNGCQWHRGGNFTDNDLGYSELYTRWFQMGAFLSMFRSHGTDVRREMWSFNDENHMFYNTLVKYNQMRYVLFPTLYSIAGNVWKNDDSFTSPLYFHFKDEICKEISSQFMVGNDIMVCPVTKAMYYTNNSVKLENTNKYINVFFPSESNWVDYETGEIIQGGTYKDVYAPIDCIPVFIKEGGILLKCNGGESASEALEKPLTIEIYAGANGCLDWYIDSGDGYEYEKGEFCSVRLIYDDNAKILTLSEKEGTFVSIHQNMDINIILKSGNLVVAQKNILYDGKKQKIIL